ncbi:MAG TPA: bifunctional UDP-N-acetylglucosamine diphosphorylase/glucosamine-1-phosphate N-acetyltransferase GlmU [Candidatus Acidoferrales bacterium]|jgi:bifunctional UDP-N-acetylglucosamine pyrophosphorylase/glucosamine-1-phosphate N-acetyltransferase|nr:bifunctional UDP-N-acetylglucosamine diphosphorylase/glucosamine-1-phosphate N-acetyltransferase GlmU [Candidatus Acidoferrales bacterium]
MAHHDTVIVILAAGKGTRLKSDLAKVLHRAGGRTLIEHVVRACGPLDAAEVLVVVGHQAADVRAAVAPLGAKTVLQEPQQGTGHAMLAAREAIGPRAKYAIVLPGDAPLIRTETLAALAAAHRESRAAATILTAILGDPTGYGRIVRHKDARQREGSVGAIVEEKAANDEQRAIHEINSSIYCFTLDKLWPCLAKIRPDNAHHELYLTDAIALLNRAGEVVRAQVAADAQEVLGCNTRAELADVDRVFRRRKTAELMAAGATIYLPETVLVDAEVEAGHDSVIEPAVQLLGGTRIGARCIVRTGSILIDAELADDVEVRPHCLIAASRLGAGVVVGPFAHLRDGAELRAGARVGNYVEVKKSVLGEGVKAMHLTYLGDATIGRDTNVGAGTITCNYDGVRKNPTTIGERVFIGSDTALVAPVKIGDGAYIAAGSTITEDVPADSLGIARGRQVTKPGWATERRAKMAAAKAAAGAASSVTGTSGASGRSGTNPGHNPSPQDKSKPTKKKKKPGKR